MKHTSPLALKNARSGKPAATPIRFSPAAVTWSRFSLLGMCVNIAEGGETEAQANFLLSADCAYAQGYYFSRPVNAERATELL
jgi:hypothetical protein